MQITKKIVKDGEIVGYYVDDAATGMDTRGASFALPMCKKALYTELYIQPLTQSGYKYYGYDADTIECPDGTPISELPAVDFSEVDMLEWNASVSEIASNALSDFEAAKYYTFREESAYQFKRETSYKINTREEFLKYLKTTEMAFYNVAYVDDNRPLNYFVNPDAMFTIDELIANPELTKYFDIILKRHKFRSYKKYQELIEWLCQQGVLNTATPTMGEFLAAYYAWGPEGINDKCTKFEVKLNVDGSFSYVNDPLSSATPDDHTCSNREMKAILRDANSTMHFLRQHQSFRGVSTISELDRSRIVFSSDPALMSAVRSDFNGFKYMADSHGLVSDVSDRLYTTLISQSGYGYTYKVAHNKIMLKVSHGVKSAIFSADNNFSIGAAILNATIPLDCVKSDVDYFLWNISIAKAFMLVRDKTYFAPVKSTAEFLLKDGLNPVAVVGYIAHAIEKHDPNEVNMKYTMEDGRNKITEVFDAYNRPIPDIVLDAYGLTQEDLENGVESFLELADVDDLRDRRAQMDVDALKEGMPGYDYTYASDSDVAQQEATNEAVRAALKGADIGSLDAVDYYTKLKFVQDCLHGDATVDNFGLGKQKDAGARYMRIAELLMTVAYAEYNDAPTIEAANTILTIDTSNLLDINLVVKTRDLALKGYKIDFSRYRHDRANLENTWLWAYCTKVFREISNAPVEQQRPYLMELVVIENAPKVGKDTYDSLCRKIVTKCVEDSIEKANFSNKHYLWDGADTGESDLTCANANAEYIAAQLFFYTYAGGIKTPPDENGNYHVTINVVDTMNLDVEIPGNVYDFIKQFDRAAHTYYIPVFEYCKLEYIPTTPEGTFNWLLVNADVDPWHVKPKKGYSIKTYPLLPNYLAQEDLDKSNGNGFYELATTNKAIAVQPLKDKYKYTFLPAPVEGELEICYQEMNSFTGPEDYYAYLRADQTEFIFAYVKRWIEERKKARAMGKGLVSIPLKQDIAYGALAYTCCDSIPSTEPVYTDAVGFDDRQCQKCMDTTTISWRQFTESVPVIATKTTSIHQFSYEDIESQLGNIQLIMPILTGEYQCSIPIVISGNYINVKADKLIRVAVSKLTPSQIQDFVNSSILLPIADNKYFIRAMNGDFVLEV